jgi:DNA-binding CsgD family transcriptional regulator
MKNRSVDRHLEFCTTDYQRQVIKLHISGLSQSAIAKQLSRHPKRVHALISTVHTKAALAGFAPSFNLDRETAPGFATKRVSTAYNTDNEIVLQWHIQEPIKQRLELLSGAVCGRVEG